MTEPKRPPVANAAAVALVAITAVAGFILLLLLALVIGGLTGMGYWALLIPTVMFVLFGVAMPGRQFQPRHARVRFLHSSIGAAFAM